MVCWDVRQYGQNALFQEMETPGSEACNEGRKEKAGVFTAPEIVWTGLSLETGNMKVWIWVGSRWALPITPLNVPFMKKGRGD